MEVGKHDVLVNKLQALKDEQLEQPLREQPHDNEGLLLFLDFKTSLRMCVHDIIIWLTI